MRKLSLLFLIGLVFSIFCLFYFESSKAQNKSSSATSAQGRPAASSQQDGKLKRVSEMIQDSKSTGVGFEQRELFQAAASLTAVAGDDAQLREVLNDGATFDLNVSATENLLQEKADALTLPLPDGKGGTIELELVRVDIFASGFKVTTSVPTNEPLDESLGVHYRGIVKGDDHSLAAISIFKDEVMGFYSTESGGNFVLGRLGGDNPTNRHVLYAEKDLLVSSNFSCNTQDTGLALPQSVLQDADAVAGACVRIYIEADYDLFQNKGSVSSTTSYLTGMFNQSATLYANDDIPVSISEIHVWNSPSPYTATDSAISLNQFESYRTTFNGDLAHLVTTGRGYGGRAEIDSLCGRNAPYAVSDIHPTYDSVPTYSWTVYVFTHETGHNLGSRHTHACVWNGNGTAIDSCGPTYDPIKFTEGSCSGAPIPSNGGTIMSYCHLLPSVGVNFSLGFGPQPRNVILNGFNSASCLTSCGGGGNCVYALSPTSRSFSTAGGSSSFTVTTGGSCSWTATVNAPATPENLPASPQGDLLSPGSDPASGSSPMGTAATTQAVWLNSTPISINDRPGNSNPPGIGSPYPSNISVSGMTGTITKVEVALNDLSHTFADDIDVLLVGPSGQRVILISDAGGNSGLSGVNLTFDQSAAAMPDAAQIVSGTYRPTNFNTNTSLEPSGVDNFPSPGPGQTVYGSDLNVFNGSAPNGTWRLYVVDDEGGDSGSIATGWALGITTNGGGTSWINITSGSSGTGNGTVSYTVADNPGASQRTGTITVNGQVHTITQAGGGGGCPSTTIAPGQTINGSLTTSDCVLTGTTRYADLYGFSGTAGQKVAVSMSSSAFDTYLYLVNSSNQILGENDDSGGSTNSRIPITSGFFTLPATGSYSILASSFSPDKTGAYSISLVNETVCTFSISPTSRSFSSPGGSSSFSVSTASGCAWSAVSNASWITTTSSGSGNGTVSYAVAANSGTSQRTGTITAGGKTHTITQSGAPANVQVTVQTNPSGRSFTVDGTTYTSAQTFSWTSGSSHTIATSSPQNGSAGTRYVWGSWSDGGAISHSVAPTGNATYTATFATQHFLTMSAGAGGTVSPASGWYNSGTGVSISATPSSGFIFGGWTGNGSGSFTGSSNPASVTMNGPVSETASFNTSGGNAVYDSVLKAPKCGQVGSACNSGALLNGRGNMTGGQESNQPNTINNSCADGSSGSYHVDESIDAIKVSTLDGGDFAPGKAVKVEVTVWSFSTSSDYLDLYYAGNASNPSWVHLVTFQPQATGSQVLTTTYQLPAGGSLQAVRARFRWQGLPSSCGTGGFDDHDDLIFAALPSVTINNAAVTEGNTGTTNASFTVNLSAAASREVRVNYQTANGSALAGSDYQATQGQLIFSPGQTSKSVVVPVIGDLLAEVNETFLVNLSSPINAGIADGQGVGTITDNEVSTKIRVNNVTVTEKNTGVNVNAIFTVSLTAASQQTVTVRYATANGTALATADYGARSLTTLTFLPGQITKTVAVQVRGDVLDELNETFKLILSSPTNATLYVSQGVCTIIDNDLPPSVTISNASVAEPDSGTINAAFTVTLSAPSGRPVSVKYQTAPGTAASGVDYTARALTTLTFSAGQTTKTITVPVRGDTAAEPNETFFVNLSAPVNVTIADAQGLGTIVNDD